MSLTSKTRNLENISKSLKCITKDFITMHNTLLYSYKLKNGFIP